MDASQIDDDGASPANLELVRAHYAAYAGGDIDALVAGLDPNVAISIHDEHGKGTGELIVGREAARGFFEGIFAAVSDSTVEVGKLRADHNRVLAQVSLAGTLLETGVSGEIPAVHLFAIHEGLITHIRTHRPEWRNSEEPDSRDS